MAKPGGRRRSLLHFWQLHNYRNFVAPLVLPYWSWLLAEQFSKVTSVLLLFVINPCRATVIHHSHRGRAPVKLLTLTDIWFLFL